MDSKSTLRYFRYRRKSSEDNKERQAASLEDQAYVLDGIEARHHASVGKDFEESKSAHSPDIRPVFAEMLKRIEAGEANAILTWHPNRICRNMTDGGKIIDLMDKGLLVEILTPSRAYQNTPMDKFMLILEFGISKKDSDDKSIAVKRGLEKKLRDGWRPGVAPEGYLNDRTTESGFRKILTDPERMPFMRKIFMMFYEGTSVVELQRLAKEEWHYLTRQKKRLGGKSLYISTIYWILRNPFYCGKFEYPIGSGHWYEGNHEKAVTQELFDAIQVKLGGRSPYKLKTHDFSFSGLMKCGICGSGVVAEEKWQCICRQCKLKFSITKNNKDRCTGCGTLIAKMDNPTILHYEYYRCGKKKDRFCLEKSVRIDDLEGQVLSRLGKIDLPECFLEWAVEQVYAMGDEDKDFQKQREDTKQRSLVHVKQKLQNLLQLKISPANSDGSLLTDEEYKVQKQPLEQEIKVLEQELGGNGEKLQEANEKTIEVVSFAVLAQERFKGGNAKVKRNFFVSLGLHPTLQEKMVKFDSPKYLLELEKIKKDIGEELERVAPSIQVDNAIQMHALFSSIPSVLRG